MKNLSAVGIAVACQLLVSVAIADLVPGQGTWETTLQARDLDGNAANGPEAFYDTDLKITWLRAAATRTIIWKPPWLPTTAPRSMEWSDAKIWAEQEHFGLTGWRLPATVDKDTLGCNYSNLVQHPVSSFHYMGN